MNSKIKILSLTSLLAISALSGCGQTNKSASYPFETWTSLSTQKVIKQTHRNEDFEKAGDKVEIKMMRDEYESSQLIITSRGKQYFDLTKSPLVDKETGKTIPTENIEIYVQKYITLEIVKHTSSNHYFYPGEDVPDMLLPLEYAKKRNENFVDKDSNQGITIEIDSNGLEAGTYEGNFLLEVGGKKKEIPVEVTIWDFTLEGKSSLQTCWLIYSMYMLTGEYDGTKSMINTYADFLTKYKANPYVIQEEAMNSPEAFMQDVERMWGMKNFNSIIIPYDFPLTYDVNSYQGNLATSYIAKLAEKSTEENFYLDYALFYPSTYDEADAFPAKKEASPSFFEPGGRYQQTLEKAIAILESKGYFSKHSSEWNERIKTAIRNIPPVFTNCDYMEKWVKEWPAVFCPKINVIDYQKVQEAYHDYSALNANGNFWTYTCLDPNYPYPSHHIDDDCLSMRVMGWMEKAYNINGYLFFMANMYTIEHSNYQYTTPYIIADRNGGANGDGFIMYPGRYYGSSTPFPSMRLVTYRDGLEDYDMLEVYERKLDKIAKEYGVTDLDTKAYVSDLYSSLFTNTVPTLEHDSLYSAREELANRIINFDNEDNLFTRITNDSNGINLHIYSSLPTLSVNGASVTCEQISSNHYHGVYPLGRNKEMLTINTGRHYYSINNPGYVNLTNLAEATPTIEMSENSFFVKEGNKIVASIKSVEKETMSKTIRFTPSITFKNLDLSNAKKLMFRYGNTSSSEDLSFDVDVIMPGRVETIGGHFCRKGNSKALEIDLSKVKFDLSKVQDLRVTFMNYFFDEDSVLHLYDTRNMFIEDMFVMY